MKYVLFTAVLLMCVANASASETDVFVSGEGGYHSYRIPSIIKTKAGTLLAFAEARKLSRSDTGDIDLVMRRSEDHGKTWSKMDVVWDDSTNTCGNPCPVVDQSTGTIWLLLTWNHGKVHEKHIKPGFGEDSRRVFVSSSTDDGKSWESPTDITTKTKGKSWTWYATGPGSAIQIQHGKHAGRMVVPCDHKTVRDGKTLFYSHVIYSDDHGKSWQLGGLSPRGTTNECEVVELEGGRLMLNMRNYDREVRARQVCLSDDGGETWHSQHHDKALLAPTCQASIHRLRFASDGKPGVVLFSNPASTKARERLTIRASYDDGKSWPTSKLLHAGGSAYSSLCVINDERIGCLYEKDNYKTISLAVLSFADLQVKDATTWNELPPLPNSLGVAGPFVGVHNDALMVAGGANFPKPVWENDKVWHDNIFVLSQVDGKDTWTRAGKLPRPIGYGAAVSTARGVVCMGGNDAAKTYSDVFLLKWKAKTKVVERVTLPSLPKSCAFGAAAAIGTKVYLAGGQSGSSLETAMSNMWVLDLAKQADDDFSWRELKPWPGKSRALNMTVSLHDGEAERLFVISGRRQEGERVEFLRDTWRFTPATGEWKKMADVPRSVMAGIAAAYNSRSILVLGGADGSFYDRVDGLRDDHPGFPRESLIYDVEVNAWKSGGAIPRNHVTTIAVPWRDGIVVPSGEVRPRVRSAKVWHVRTKW